jgi:CheY-like chemotaxis protein
MFKDEFMHITPTLDLLIVDDEEDIRLLLTQVFRARGLTVRNAADGFEALQKIQEAAPDALLSDLNMPGMSGFELLSVVRRLYPSIHVIATSGAYSGPAVPQGIAADGFHQKATGITRLFGLIANAQREDASLSLSARNGIPLWVDLERTNPTDAPHVLISCPKCLRPFRQPIIEVHARIRQTSCIYCQAIVSYALALAVNPIFTRDNSEASTAQPHSLNCPG